MSRHHIGHVRKAQRREEARARQASYEALRPAAKLQRLEANGHGACKQADKLRKQITKEKTK